MARDLYIAGGGGQAREARAVVRLLDPEGQRWSFRGYVEIDEQALGRPVGDSLVVATQRQLKQGVADVVIGIGSPQRRRAVVVDLSSNPLIGYPTLVHPSASFDSAPLSLGPGTLVAASVVGTVDVEIGQHCLVNFGVTLGHDVRIGDFVTVNPQAVVSGGVFLEEDCLVGAAAVVLEGRRVGRGAIVGAGSVVTHDVPPQVTVTGVPARVVSR